VAEAFSVEAKKNFRSSHIYKLNNKGERIQNEDKQMVKNLDNIKVKNKAVEDYFRKSNEELRKSNFINRNRWKN
jgi:hypothetical protein